MPLSPQNVPISLKVGIDTKSDDKQVQTNLSALSNATFQSPGEITKRDGFTAITKNILGGGTISKGVGAASFQGELITLDGTNLYSYSPEVNAQLNKGPFIPIDLSIETVIRNTAAQTQPDSAYHSGTGLQCFVWIDSGSGGINYSVIDSSTGAAIVSDALVAVTTSKAKVLTLGSYFIISYFDSSGVNLKYRAINTATPQSIAAAATIASDGFGDQYFNCTIINGSMYVAYQKSATQIALYYLSTSLTLSSQYVQTTLNRFFSTIDIRGDASNNVWVVWATQTVVISGAVGYLGGFVVNSTLTSTLLAPTIIEGAFATGLIVTNVTFLVSGTTATIYYEKSDFNSGYVYLYTNTLTYAGVAGTPKAFVYNMGLASKAFVYNGVNYLLSVYAGQYVVNSLGVGVPTSIEPTYFLLNALGQVVLKLNPSASGGYYLLGILPEVVQISSTAFSFSYLTQDNLSSSSGAIFYKTGVLSASIDFGSQTPVSKLETGNTLLLASGQLWQYDGANVVEQGFHVYPENLTQATATSGGGIGSSLNSNSSLNQIQYMAIYEWVDNQGQLNQSATSPALTVSLPQPAALTAVTFTATSVANSNVLSSVSSFAGLFVGQVLTDTTTSSNLLAGTYITQLNPNVPSITISSPAVGSHATDTFSTKDVCAITVTIPTLTATLKQNVSLVLYRTENNQTIFYRTSSLTNLTYNNTSTSSVTIVDTTPDSVLVGNEQLYTTGGDLPNINAPAVSWLTSFKNRAMYGAPENLFQAGYSKQIIPGVPAEFDSLELFENIDQSIRSVTAAGPLDDKFICFGPAKKFYFVGNGPSANGANNDFTEAQPIAGTTGCTNPASVLEIPTGLTYQDPKKGIWLLDRSLQEKYIGAPVEAYNQYPITSSKIIRDQNKAIYTLSNGVNLVYDYYVDQWETDIVVSGAVDSTIYNDNFVYLQADGTLQQQTPGTYNDNGAVIPMSLKTGWMSFAGLEGFQRVWELQILGTYFSPHTLTVNVYTDFGTTPVEVITIPVLSEPTPYQFRVKFGSGVQKCESMQIEIIESQSGTPGQGFSLSALAFRVGLKTGLNKLPAAVSY